MIPTRIISIDDKVMVKYGETIAEVENIGNLLQGENIYKWVDLPNSDEINILSLNQQVFIEPTTEGKCKIVKI